MSMAADLNVSGVSNISSSMSKASLGPESPSCALVGQGSGGMTVHEASRAKKAVETNVKAIENRISFFKREEEKIWRDLEQVRRQAATIEEGRTRTIEKKLADRAIQQEKDTMSQKNREKAVAARNAGMETRRRNQFEQMHMKQQAGQDQRRASQEILKQKKMQEAQARLANSERAVAAQRSALEAKLKVNEEKATKLERLREQQEADRIAAESEVQEAESKLPSLEAEELVCLQRLQNSRIVTQSVLEELETSLGSKSSVTSLLRQKQKGQEHFDLHQSGFSVMENEESTLGESPQRELEISTIQER
eukprot:CAMPEP_0197939736 /NCGR_PEP_ID=MMETSP1439-20131203/120136_1 /TAXON_ID=66791 /ORGANISM="Gonyaulax spinifera, Strain CCMP409" /LENGTH=307 /DNA_ID=CAMNT_0043562869 /DNA_START=76 /DNA_END=999 /DNA_ORIENTATION=+